MANIHFDLTEWFSDLVGKKLRQYQGIELDAQTARDLLIELKNTSFHKWQVPAAEMWILHGNWQYKKPKVLTIQDFYPNAELLKPLGQFISLEKHVQDLKELKTELENSFEERVHTSVQMQIKTELVSLHQSVAQNKEILDLGSENTDLKYKIKKLESKIESLLNRIEREKS